MVDLFDHRHAVAFEAGDLRFIGRDDGRAVGFDDAFEEAVDLGFDLFQAAFERGPDFGGLAGALIPGVAEQAGDERGQVRRRLQRAEQLVELILHMIAADGFAFARASPVLTEIIGMPRAAAARRPAGGDRLGAVGAMHEPAQGEIGVDILAGGGLGLFLQPFLDALIGRERNQAFVMALAQGHVPVGRFDIARVDGPRQKIENGLIADIVVTVAATAKRGLAFEKALDLGLRLKAARRIAFERFLNDRGHRLVPYQHLAVAGKAAIGIAHGGAEAPVAVHGARPHAVVGLFAVLLALMLRHAGEQVLDEDRIGILAELDGRAFEDAARLADFRAQFQMRLDAAREAADIVDDDGERPRLLMLAQEGQHRLHAGTRGQTAAHVVAEDLDDSEAFVAGIFAAARFLGIEAVAFRLLLLARHAAIDDGLGLAAGRIIEIIGAHDSLGSQWVGE